MKKSDFFRQYKDKDLIKDLGLFFAGHLKSDEEDALGPCPPIEDIAAFVDGRLDNNQRQQMVEHFADCRDCYEVFSQTMDTVKALSAEKKKRFIWLGAPALALAASLIIFVMMTPFGPGADLPSSHEMLCRLAEVVEISQLTKPSFDEPSGRMYGFAGSLSPQKMAFALGLDMAGLELALSGNYPEHVLHYLSLLKKNAGKESWDSYLRLLSEDMESSLKQGKKGLPGVEKNLHLLRKKMAAEMKKENTMAIFRLGEWCKIGRAVLLSGQREAISQFLSDIDRLQVMTRSLKKEGVPAAVLKDMDEIIRNTGQMSPGDRDVQSLIKKIENIISFMT